MSRGANPRTGLITPFISVGNSENGGNNDYVHVKRVQNEADPRVGAGERWRQDELGWSLVEGMNEPDPNTATNCFGKGTALSAAQEQIYEPQQWGPALIPRVPSHTQVEHYVDEAQSNTYRAPKSTSKDQIAYSDPRPALPSFKSLSASPFQIPRKDVGSNRPASRSPTAGLRSHGHLSLARNGRKAELTDNPLQSGLHCSPYYAHPAGACPCRSSQCNQAISLKAEPKHGSSDLAGIHPHQAPYSSEVFSHRVNPRPTSINPNLKVRDRRPTQLFSVPPRVHPSNKGDPNVKNADGSLSIPDHVVLEQRPHFKRVQATTAVPVIQLSKHVGSTEPGRNEAPPVPYQARAILAQNGNSGPDASTQRSNSRQLNGIMKTAYKNPNSLLAFEPHPIAKQSTPPDQVNTVTSVTKVHATKLTSTASSTIGRPCTSHHAEAESQVSEQKTSNTAGADMQEQASSESRLVRRKSTGQAVGAQESLLTFAGEVCAAIDWESLLGQLAALLKHATLTWRQMPWAARMLRSQNAEVWEYLLAVRHVVLTLLYLTMLLAVLGSILRVLKLVVELGSCLWYPMGLVLTVMRWILLH